MAADSADPTDPTDPARRTEALWRRLLRSFLGLLMWAAVPYAVGPVHVMIDYSAAPFAEDPGPDEDTAPAGRPLTRAERRDWTALAKQLR